MARLACVLLLLAVASCSASESRIVGGTPADIEKYPWMAAIESHAFGFWSQTCGGVILTNRHVLTTATCMPLVTPHLLRRVRVGSTYRRTGGVIASVLRTVNHPSYGIVGGRDGDITIVFLRNSLVFSNTIAQATIVAQGSTIPASIPVTQIGWGITAENEQDIRATRLHEVAVVTGDREACDEIYNSLVPIPIRVTENMICADLINTSTGACLGDFGGPLVFSNIVVGLMSWGIGCINNTLPTIHTAVSSYTDWIVQTAV